MISSGRCHVSRSRSTTVERAQRAHGLIDDEHGRPDDEHHHEDDRDPFHRSRRFCRGRRCTDAASPELQQRSYASYMPEPSRKRVDLGPHRSGITIGVYLNVW